jgi:hypothetical protein
MDLTWNEILIKFMQLVVYGVVSVGIPLLFSLAQKYIKNTTALKILENLKESAIGVVETINEEFVNSLKEQGKFDADAQAIAFETAKARILLLLNEQSKQAILLIYGDLDTWLEGQIKKSVTDLKIAKVTAGLPLPRQLLSAK